MIVERAMHPGWLSNAYLVADEPGGHGLVIDSGGPSAELLAKIEEHDVTVTHLFLTHHHPDHIAENDVYKERFGVEILAHPIEAELIEGVDRTVEAGESILEVGTLKVGALLTPGHTGGMLNPVVDGTDVFTGDTLFRRSVGGVRKSGSTGFGDLKRSVMEVLMKLPPQTRLHPGHTDPTTVAEEWESNPFVRLWRGLDAEGDEPVGAMGKPATLILLGPDYDGGHKAWVRWPDGKDDIVPGSKIECG